MKIIVASTNPVKIDAVKRVALVTWPGAEVVGIETESGVSAQPMSDEETKQGSINRAKNALASTQYLVPSTQQENQKLAKDKVLSTKNQVIAIGLEGGVFENEVGEMWNTVWVSIVDKKGNTLSVNGSRFKIPEDVTAGIRSGEEMGVVVDRIAGTTNTRHKEGFIGYLTKNIVTRTDEYSNLVKLAVGIWLGKS